MKITREGKRFVLAALLIAVAAVNTGNNLIYLILSLMLSFVLLSVLLLRINLSGLLLEVRINPPVFAGEEASMTVLTKNKKRFIPTYSINILTAGAAPVYCILLPARGQMEKVMKIRYERRGLYSYGDFQVSSGFPFILFNKIRTVTVSGEALVYPALRDVGNIVPEMSGKGGLEAARMSGSGDEIYSIREFKYGDDWRKIHWKASAKASGLMVREYAEHGLSKTTIIVDNLMPPPHPPLAKGGQGGGSKERITATEELTDELFEKVVSLTGSLASYFLDMGHVVRILSCKKVIPFGGGDEHLYKILDTLAVIREEEAWDCPVPYDGEGFFISVLKSSDALVDRYTAVNAVTVYADTL